jgi:hypothetical protein
MVTGVDGIERARAKNDTVEAVAHIAQQGCEELHTAAARHRSLREETVFAEWATVIRGEALESDSPSGFADPATDLHTDRTNPCRGIGKEGNRLEEPLGG